MYLFQRLSVILNCLSVNLSAQWILSLRYGIFAFGVRSLLSRFVLSTEVRTELCSFIILLDQARSQGGGPGGQGPPGLEKFTSVPPLQK